MCSLWREGSDLEGALPYTAGLLTWALADVASGTPTDGLPEDRTLRTGVYL